MKAHKEKISSFVFLAAFSVNPEIIGKLIRKLGRCYNLKLTVLECQACLGNNSTSLVAINVYPTPLVWGWSPLPRATYGDTRLSLGDNTEAANMTVHEAFVREVRYCFPGSPFSRPSLGA